MNDNNEHRLIAERRAKLNTLRELGPAFPNDFRPQNLAGELQSRFVDSDKETLAEQGVQVSVAGRMMAQRVMGKASFAQLQDRSGQIQIFVQRDALARGSVPAVQALGHWRYPCGARHRFSHQQG